MQIGAARTLTACAPAFNYMKKRIIAPRLKNGESRVGFGHGLPEAIKEGIRRIARDENKSMSWVMEEVIIEYFGFTQPKYLERKKKNEFDKKARTRTN